MIRPVLFALCSLLFLAGCGSSTIATRITVTERPDSLVIKGDSIAFQAKSDSLRVDSVHAIPSPGANSSAFFKGEAGRRLDSSRRGSVQYLYRSVHAKKDTTVGRWKLSFAYDYPPDRWTIKILEADTTARWKVRDSLIDRPYEVEKIPWWMSVLVCALGVALIIALLKR